MKSANFFAVDLGATSGRTIVGSIIDGKLEQREITRFQNNIIQTGGHFYWDIFSLYSEILNGLKKVAEQNIDIQSIGIDTWGVDFVCVGKDGNILRNPFSYRDPHTDNAMDEYFKVIPKQKVYEKTGIQFMQFNSLFQLWAMRQANDSALEAADKILFVPDALMYMLTGKTVCEYTILSTSQILDPRTKRIDTELIAAVGLTERHFGDYVNPSQVIGTITKEVQTITGLGPIPVVAVAGHDTAAAVASAPSLDEHFAYLSCGTWSLLGIETKEAIISDESFKYNFTNEGGIEGTTRFLKNICGMWLLERCRKEWKPTDNPVSDEQAPADINVINRDASEMPPFLSFINPDDPSFANPESMVGAIQEFCKKNGQYVPHGYIEITRCILDSLAMRYRQVMEMLKGMAPFPIERLHVIGGGTYNKYLMQMAANSTGLTVVTGPVEGTAIGNIMLQAKAAGMVADRFEMRKIIANSIDLKVYQPADKQIWEDGYKQYLQLFN